MSLSTLFLSASRPDLRIGYLPLTDAAPLLVAQAQGLFARQGLRVSLAPAGAWAALRDRLAFGALDAAHMIYPMPIAAALGLGQPARDWVAACGLGHNGNTLILSHPVAQALGAFTPPLAPTAFAALAHARASAGQPLRLAVVHAYSTHSYLLREWLAAGGLNPESDLRLEVVPPPLVAEELNAGRIDGFCAGEPWGSHAVLRGAGVLALGSGSIWPNHSEKLLVFSGDIAARERPALVAATAAVIEAARWLDDATNRDAAIALLQEAAFPDLDAAAIAPALAGQVPDGAGGAHTLRFPLRFRPATRPDHAQARAWLGRMRRWGHLPEGASESVALAPFANDIWAEAAQRVTEPEPQPATLPEGLTP